MLYFLFHAWRQVGFGPGNLRVALGLHVHCSPCEAPQEPSSRKWFLRESGSTGKFPTHPTRANRTAASDSGHQAWTTVPSIGSPKPGPGHSNPAGSTYAQVALEWNDCGHQVPGSCFVCLTPHSGPDFLLLYM
jgi:hypothetical protein